MDFQKGDQVKIVCYGDIEMKVDEEEGNLIPIDTMPHIVGMTGTIEVIHGVRFPKFAIAGIPGKYAWYNKEQLEKI